MIGWICLSRKILDCYLWEDKPFSKGQAWIDLLLMASHEKKRFLLGNDVVEIDRGSFITSELKLMNRWGWSKSKVRSFLCLLESEEMITKKTDSKKTAITIVNYGKYQDLQTAERPQKDREQTAKKPQKDTINNENNENNKNKEKENNKKKDPPTIDEIKDYCIEKKLSVDPEDFYNFFEAGHWVDSNGKPVLNWKQKLLTWEKFNNKGKSKPKPTEPFNATNYILQRIREEEEIEQGRSKQDSSGDNSSISGPFS